MIDGLKLFSTCPQSADHSSAEYLARVVEAATWSDELGFEGMLVYTDNRLVDAWLVAQLVLQNTNRLCPLVAVQPVYMHPYTVANMVASFAYLHGRRIYLNLVAGGFKNDLTALSDDTPHDRRYDRLVEYTHIVLELARRSPAGAALTFEGAFYRVDKLKLTPAVPAELLPGVLLSGSSDAGLAAASALDATAVQYPRRPSDYDAPLSEARSFGIRVGIVARADAADAWRVAHDRFPPDRRGQIAHQLAMKTTDSHWHKQLSALEASAGENGPYWLHPFENYKTFCPYLVGSYEDVATELRRYIDLGYRTFILDIPSTRDELEHTVEAFAHAAQARVP